MEPQCTHLHREYKPVHNVNAIRQHLECKSHQSTFVMQRQAMRKNVLCKNKQCTSYACASKACASQVHVGYALASNTALRRAKTPSEDPGAMLGSTSPMCPTKERSESSDDVRGVVLACQALCCSVVDCWLHALSTCVYFFPSISCRPITTFFACWCPQ